jgi:hypothetical protein
MRAPNVIVSQVNVGSFASGKTSIESPAATTQSIFRVEFRRLSDAQTPSPVAITDVRVTCVGGPTHAGQKRQRLVIHARYAQICA